jgi:hypothetical protein
MILNDDNFLLYAMNHYDNPQCHSIDEFEDDVKRFLYVKKLFSRYRNSDELRERLILNHIIVLYNVFGDHVTNMLFFKIEQDLWSSLKSFIIFLDRLPEYPKSGIHDIVVDINCLSELYKIYNGKEET